MSKSRIYLATAIDKEIGSTTYYVMDSEKFARILGEDLDGIEATLAEIEEQTPSRIFTLVGDLIVYLKENDLEIAEEAVGVFAPAEPESTTEAQGN
jgi:hypothetical protein